MEKTTNYLFTSGIDKEEAIKIFKEKLQKDKRFVSDYSEEYLGIEEKYFAYHFFDTDVLNLKYLYVNKTDGTTTDSTVDVHFSFSDSNFILNNLNKHLPKTNEFIKDSLVILNPNDYDRKYQLVIEGVKKKALSIICTKHNIKPSKNNYIDVSLIDGFNNFEVETYYEMIYVFRYRSTLKPSDYLAYVSAIDGSIYFFDFEKSKNYLEYLKRFRRPITYIPKDYLDLFYQDSFEVYSNMEKKLEYQNPKVILRKVKQNIHYNDYSAYQEYLDIGIFFFKILPYLKQYKMKRKDIKYKIYYSYLTLRHNPDSGLFLYECCLLDLLESNSINAQINYLKQSLKLGNLKAKKLLYEHYSKPEFYDPIIIKRYE